MRMTRDGWQEEEEKKRKEKKGEIYPVKEIE